MFGILLAISLLALASFAGATEMLPGASFLGDLVAVFRSPNITDFFVVGGDGYVYTAQVMRAHGRRLALPRPSLQLVRTCRPIVTSSLI